MSHITQHWFTDETRDSKCFQNVQLSTTFL